MENFQQKLKDGYEVNAFEYQQMVSVTRDVLLLTFNRSKLDSITKEDIVQIKQQLGGMLTAFFESIIVVSLGGTISDYNKVKQLNRNFGDSININKIMNDALKEINKDAERFKTQDNSNR